MTWLPAPAINVGGIPPETVTDTFATASIIPGSDVMMERPLLPTPAANQLSEEDTGVGYAG